MSHRSVRSFIAAAAATVALLGVGPARADDLAGKGSIGFAMGAMRFTGGEDLTEGAGIRPVFRGIFKYAWQEHLVSVIETGYGWNAYGEGGSFDGDIGIGTLAVVTPLTFGLDYRFNTKNPQIVPRFGAGIGAYGVKVLSGRDRTSRDPATDRKRSVTSAGFYGKAGAEYLFKPSLVLNGDFLWHTALSGDADAFPSGYLDSNVSFAEFRVGINYYFTIRSTGAAPTRPQGEDEE